jgi:hypothetical protein
MYLYCYNMSVAFQAAVAAVRHSAAQRNAGFGLGLGLELPPAVQFQLQSQSRVGKCLQLEARH